MAWLGRIGRRLATLRHRARREREMHEEIRHHLELEAESLRRRGLPPEEARRRARLAFGGVEGIEEACRDSWGVRLLETVLQDVRYGFRAVRKNPGYSAVVILTLALGIGANTAIFSVVDGVLLRPLPYGAGNRLVLLKQSEPKAGVDNLGLSVKEMADYRDGSRSLSDVVEYHSMSFTLLGGPEAERVRTGVVSANFFDVLGVKPLLGRTFLPGEDAPGAEPVLVLSYRFWQKAYGGNPGIVGRKFEMNDRVHTVVGVLPPLPGYPGDNDVYMPSSSCPFRSRKSTIEGRNVRMLTALARLEPGVGLDKADSDVQAVASRMERDHPDAYPAGDALRAELVPVKQDLTRRAKPTLLILLGTVGLVLLIACANVANLAVARLSSREHEIAVRAALGAGRRRLMRQLLTESVLLSLLGGLLGLILAALGLDLLVAFAARFTPRAAGIRIDGVVLLFTLGVSVLTGLAFGSLPGLPARESLGRSLQEGGRTAGGAGRHRLRGALVVCQLAVSFVLVTGAALMLRSLAKLDAVDPGFRSDHVLTTALHLNWSRYMNAEHRPDAERIHAFYEPLLARVAGFPGVRSAAVSWTFPLNSTWRANGSFLVEGRELASGEAPPRADFRATSPGYYATLGIPVLAGRTFDERDDGREAHVAVVNESLARHVFPGESPLGQRISTDGGKTWATIVGVVGDVRQYSLGQPPTEEIDLPFLESPGFASSLLLRTAGDPLRLARSVRRTVAALDPQTAVSDVRSLDEVRRESLASPRLTTVLIGLFALLALLITATGIGGVIAFSVSRRTQEIGVRLALGARPGTVLGMLMRQGMRSALLGLALGAVGALAFGRLMTGLLYGIEPTDAACFAGSAVVFLVVSAAACFLPARRATTIDPLVAIRAS